MLAFDRTVDKSGRFDLRWRDNETDTCRIEISRTISLREVLETYRVLRIQVPHAFLQPGDLRQLAKMRLVLMKKCKDWFCSESGCWVGSELANSRLKDCSGIYNMSVSHSGIQQLGYVLVISLMAIKCFKYSKAKFSSSGNSFMPRSNIFVPTGSL